MIRSDCGQIESELSALIDGELSAPRREAAQAHVFQCEACRALLHTLQCNRDDLLRLPRVNAPESLAMFIKQRAERRAQFGDAEAVPRGRFWLWFARVSASAALVFSGAFVSWRLFLATRTPDANPPTAVTAPFENQRIARRAPSPSSPIDYAPTIRAEPDTAVANRARSRSASAADREAGVPAVVADPGVVEIIAEDTIAVICAPATCEQYAHVVGALRQYVAAVLMERSMRAAVAPQVVGKERDIFDARRVEFEEALHAEKGMRITLRIAAAQAPAMLAMFEQVAPKCVRVNVPWSRRDQIAQVLFSQEPPPEAPENARGPKDVFAQSLESWLSQELGNLRREANRIASSRPSRFPADGELTGHDPSGETRSNTTGDAGIRASGPESMHEPRPAAVASPLNPEFPLPESFVRIPKMVYTQGGALVQSLFGALIEVPAPATKIDAIILEIELLAPPPPNSE